VAANCLGFPDFLVVSLVVIVMTILFPTVELVISFSLLQFKRVSPVTL
jgi:hypothetical protein